MRIYSMAKYKITHSNSYQKDIKKLDKETIALVENIIDRLANGEVLEPKYQDHALKGRLKGLRDCHIKPDLVLIYQLNKDVLELVALRINTHSELYP